MLSIFILSLIALQFSVGFNTGGCPDKQEVVLETISNIGALMCEVKCQHRSDCTSVNYDDVQLVCQLVGEKTQACSLDEVEDKTLERPKLLLVSTGTHVFFVDWKTRRVYAPPTPMGPNTDTPFVLAFAFDWHVYRFYWSTAEGIFTTTGDLKRRTIDLAASRKIRTEVALDLAVDGEKYLMFYVTSAYVKVVDLNLGQVIMKRKSCPAKAHILAVDKKNSVVMHTVQGVGSMCHLEVIYYKHSTTTLFTLTPNSPLHLTHVNDWTSMMYFKWTDDLVQTVGITYESEELKYGKYLNTSCDKQPIEDIYITEDQLISLCDRGTYAEMFLTNIKTNDIRTFGTFSKIQGARMILQMSVNE